MGDVAGHSASGTSCSDVARESLLSLTHVLSPPFPLPDPKFVQKKKKYPYFLILYQIDLYYINIKKAGPTQIHSLVKG